MVDEVKDKFNRILLTGAGGGLGKVLREKLKSMTNVLRVSDIGNLGDAQVDEEIVICNLSDRQAVYELVRDCDAIVHMGGVSVERPFDEILEANIKGVFNIYEAARKHNVKRIIFPSSVHAVGYYKQSDFLDLNKTTKPDGYYGISKVYGEAMASFYHDRYGIETLCIRIGSSFPEPVDHRMMHTWLSYRDLVELVRCGLFTPNIGNTIVFGMSDNKEKWWDNSLASHLNYRPQDTSEIFREKIDALPIPAADDASMLWQGGNFTRQGPFDD